MRTQLYRLDNAALQRIASDVVRNWTGGSH
jgi:hypothetical protein